MKTLVWLIVYGTAIYTSYRMAKSRSRDTGWAVVLALLIGWFAPLIYLVIGNKNERPN